MEPRSGLGTGVLVRAGLTIGPGVGGSASVFRVSFRAPTSDARQRACEATSSPATALVDGFVSGV